MRILDFLIDRYQVAKGNNIRLRKIYTLKQIVLINLTNRIIPVYFQLTSFLKKNRIGNSFSQNKKRKIVVSLTSFPNRIDKVWLVVECILRQTRKPDKIILWLSTEQFSSIYDLPKKLLALQKRGLVINFCNENLGSYKKIYYPLIKYPHDLIITIDDDLFYPSNMIEELVSVHKKFPRSVIARYGHKVQHNNKKLSPYIDWQKNEVKTFYAPRKDIFFGSGGGTLFPPNIFHRLVLEKDIFMSLCPLADDIWLNTMVRLNHRRVVLMKNYKFIPVKYKKKKSLYSVNRTKNDEQIGALRNYCEKQKLCSSFNSMFIED